eukprot:TRINITY_DN4516_c0_g1_i1.p1 TRINITY_DN4516_c0_g1~~TRINITY_DN4516_c0_g1_i1.p1  ORF type:complete len:351 (-),score=86.60 TRINITY_DN4516_c0_g1_i1:12-1064(-)
MEALARQIKESSSNMLGNEHKHKKNRASNAEPHAYARQQHIEASPHFGTGKENLQYKQQTSDFSINEKPHFSVKLLTQDKSAPDGICKHKIHEQQKKGDSRITTTTHSRAVSGLKPNGSDAGSTSVIIEHSHGQSNIDKLKQLNTSFASNHAIRREMRSYSQSMKGAQKFKLKEAQKHEETNNKPPSEKQNTEVSIDIGKQNDPSMKELVVTTNNSYIENLTINPIAYKQRDTTPKVKGSQETHGNNVEQREAEYREKASRLELELKKTVRESERSSSGGKNKISIYRLFFNEIIAADPYFGGLLREIQKAYETQINDLSEILNKQNDSCLLYTSPSPRDLSTSRMPSSA